MSGTAGFRFVEIEPRVVEPPIGFDELDLSQPHASGSVSGMLDVTWTAETPVCVGHPAPDEPRAVDPIWLGDGYLLPGASLRGMIRALAEIATFSHLGRINSARHYGVRTYDYGDMPDAHRHRPRELRAGWLQYEASGWTLRICQTVRDYDRGFWLVHFDEILAEIGRRGFDAPTADEWRDLTLGDKRTRLATAGLDQQLTLLDDGPYLANAPGGIRKSCFVGEQIVSGTEQTQRRVPGCLVCAGRTEIPPDDPQRAKVREAVFAPPSTRGQDAYTLSPEFMNLFHALHSDPGRNRRNPRGNWRYWLAAMRWLDKFEAEPDRGDPDPEPYRNYPGIPVFFHGHPSVLRDPAADPVARRSFFIGLTRVLRLPWPLSVGDVADRVYRKSDRRRYEVPRLGAPGGWDFARALFGEVDDANLDPAVTEARRGSREARALAGRVAVGPAFALGSPRPAHVAAGVLGAPRESYFPFYLARAADAAGSGTQRYDDPDAIVAGRKRYVARFTVDPLPQGNENEATRTTIRFLPSGAQFRGRIRFHNCIRSSSVPCSGC